MGDDSLFYKVERKPINFKGFTAQLIQLRMCFINNQAHQLNKRLK